MTAADTLPGQLNRAILAATDTFFQQNESIGVQQRACVGRLQQMATVEILDGSDILTAGDLKVEQRARLAFQCVPPLSAAQRAALRSQLTEAIAPVLDANLSANDAMPRLTRTQIADIVDLTLQRRDRECRAPADGVRGLAVAPGVQIEGSKIQVGGCTEQEARDYGDQCRRDIANLQFDSKACKALNDCARSKSSLTLIQSDVSIDDKCPRLESITDDLLNALALIASAAANKPGSTKKDDKKSDNGSGLSTAAIIGIAVGGFVLLLLIVTLVVAAVAKRRRLGASPATNYSAPMLSSYESLWSRA